MRNPNHLLLIDDNPTYCQLLALEGRQYGFEVIYFHNLEDGFDALTSSRRYKALVLDGHCMLEPGMDETAKPNFVYHALHRLNELEHGQNRSVPFCINSETPAEFVPELEGIAQVFNKIVQHQQMFEYLKKAIAELPEMAIRNRYADIFEKTAGVFSPEDEDLLIDILQAAGTSSKADIVTTLALLRRMLELLMDISCIKHLQKSPDEFTRGPGSRTRLIIESLNPRVLPPELFVSANNLYKICSKFGSHHDRSTGKENSYHPRKYGLQRLVYSYIELLDFLID